MKISRVEKAGEQMAKAIIEMVNLMYQKNTAKNFWKGFFNIIIDDNDNDNFDYKTYNANNTWFNQIDIKELKE